MDSPPALASPSKTTSPRPSKFIEGEFQTGPDLISRTPASNGLFLTILSEMDEFEARRSKNASHRGSTSSSSAADSPVSISPTNTLRFILRDDERLTSRRSIDAKRQRQSFDGIAARWAPVEQDVHDGLEKVGKAAQKIKGRLRALTSSSQRDSHITPSPGT